MSMMPWSMFGGAGAQAPTPQPTATPVGMLAPGNINVHDRPKVQNADGTISTVHSASFTIEDANNPHFGKQLLIPTVWFSGSDGQPMSNKAAEAYHQSTGKWPPAKVYDGHTSYHAAMKYGENLGIFDTPDNATTASKALHEQQAQEYNPDPQGTPQP